RRHGRDRSGAGDRAPGAPVTLDPTVGRILLQLVLWLPLLGALVVAMAGNGQAEPSPDLAGGHGGAAPHGLATGRVSLRAWRIATAFALITFLLAAWLLIGFDR